MKNGEQPAYPTIVQGKYADYIEFGLTKRDVFAIHFAAAFCSSPDYNLSNPEVISAQAVKHADALLAELEKTGEKP